MPMRYINQDEVFAVIEQRFRGPVPQRRRGGSAPQSRAPDNRGTSTNRPNRAGLDRATPHDEGPPLLVETDLGAAEVGRRIGYPDATYFGYSQLSVVSR